MTAVAPLDGWGELLNPFTHLGNAAGKVVADAWTTAMLALWNAGLWLLRLVLGLTDAFLTPDLREAGPMGSHVPADVLGGRDPGGRPGWPSSPGSPRSAATRPPWAGCSSAPASS